MSDQHVVVAGMHRAGTSAVMRMLAGFGIGIGPAESLMGAMASNPFGHFEQVPVVAFNDELLDAVGSHWVAPQDRAAALEQLASGELGDRARSLIDALFGDARGTWAVKDPRFCITMPFWGHVLATPAVIIPVRHPYEVAASLQARDQIPHDHGVSLWRVYYELLVRDSDGLNRCVVNYDDVLRDPHAVATQLASFAHLDGDIGAAASMIDDGVRHHAASAEQPLPDDVNELWDALRSGSLDAAGAMIGARIDVSPFDAFGGVLAVERQERIRLRDELDSARVADSVLAEAMQDRDKARHHFSVAWAARQRALDEQQAALEELQAAQAHRDRLHDQIRELEDRLAERDAELESIYSSKAGKAMQSLWTARVKARETTARVRSGDNVADVLASVTDRPADLADPVQFQRPAEPDVSVVIPVHGELAYTAACLRSLANHDSHARFEVIVVNDASPDATREWLATCSGLEVVDLETNVGYLRATNAGLKRSRGEFVLLLNNDTTVEPDCIDALVDLARRDETIGAVGAKLIYPNGQLQEAGAIIWREGNGWNYGRGGDPYDYRYDFVREVDYCSAACLLVRRDPFAELGWFDERYAPAYYEDTDLCFALRDRGLKVMYQPAAAVIHHEGISHGTDESAGLKAHQVTNQKTFADKWAGALGDQWPDGTSPRLASWRGAGKRFIVFDHEVPAPDQDSGSVRMDALLSILRDMGYRVTFFPHNRTHRGRYNRRLELAGIETGHGWEDWADLVTDYGPELGAVFASRPSVAAEILPLVTNRIPDVPTVYDMVDFHGLRVQRELDLEGAEQNKHAKVMTELERALVRMADITVAITDDEAKLVAELEPEATIVTIPNIHDSPASTASFDERNGVVFIGSYRHPPNRDAIRWLMDDIMPVVWASNPTVMLHLVGSDLPADIVDPSIRQARVHGWLEDLDGLYNDVRLSVAPLRYGAGMKGKIGDSLIRGVPVITTPVGAEGFGEVTDTLVIADTATQIAAKILELHEDAAGWTALADAGRVLTAKRFGRAAAEDAVEGLARLL